MELRQLKSFLHVAELGSLSRAAERLDLSQPALSRQLKLLEGELQVRLFERTGRGVNLTDAGRLLEQRARAVLDEVDRISTDLSAQREAVSGRVVFGLPSSVGVTLSGLLVERYRSSYPTVSLQIIEDLSGAIQEGLLLARIDLGILYEGTTSANLRTERLWSEELCLVGPAAAGLQRPVAFRRIAEYALILPGPRHGLRALLEQYAFRHGVNLRTDIEVDSLRGQLDLVQRGVAFSILPRNVCAAGLAAGTLSMAPIVEPALIRRWVLAWPLDRPLSRAARAMADMIRAELAGWKRRGAVQTGR